MMRWVNDVVLDNVYLRRQLLALHQALVTVLEETAGGSFVRAEPRERARELLQETARYN